MEGIGRHGERGENVRRGRKHHGNLKVIGKIQKFKVEFEKRTVSTKVKDADFYFWVTMWLPTPRPNMHATSIILGHSFPITMNFESATPWGAAIVSKQGQ